MVTILPKNLSGFAHGKELKITIKVGLSPGRRSTDGIFERLFFSDVEQVLKTGLIFCQFFVDF